MMERTIIPSHGEGFFDKTTFTWRKHSFDLYDKWVSSFVEDQLQLDQKNFILPADKAYLKRRVYAEHSDSDVGDDDIKLPELNFDGNNITAAQLMLMQEVPSDEEGSPMKTFKKLFSPKKG